MQRSLFILFVVVMGWSNVSAQLKPDFPDTREIVKHFYAQYDSRELDYPNVVFEKHKNGWIIVTQKIQKQSLVPDKKFLFYNNRTHSYQILPLVENKAPLDVDPAAYLNNYQLTNYELQPYFGYKGWYKDVISEWGSRKDLSENELYALGRAYSNYSGCLLSDQSGDALLKEMWKLPLRMNCLKVSQIAQFDSLQEKAQACFKSLAEMDPDYQTVVGKIGIKYSNEIMYQYHLLLAYANDYALKMKLPDNLYSDSLLKSISENLENAPRDAILLSFGDNDFYPVLYLQYAKGIRKDVYVINYNLLGTDRFIARTVWPQFDARAIQLSSDTLMYKDTRNDVVYRKDSAYAMPVRDLLKVIRTGRADQYGTRTFFADHIILPAGQDKANMQPAKVSLLKTGYLLKNQWILLDIMNNLNGRNICFPNNFIDELKGLNEFLISKEGLLIYNN